MPFKTKEEKAEYDKKRYLENREAKLAYMKEYRLKNPNVRKEWRECNREKVNAQKRKWRMENRDRVLALRKAYEETDRAKELQKKRRDKWAQLNPLKARESHLAAVYRRKAKIGSGKIPKHILNQLLTDMTCGICVEPIVNQYHIDHIIPVAKGGEHTIDNLQLAHPLCNLRKGAKILSRT